MKNKLYIGLLTVAASVLVACSNQTTTSNTTTTAAQATKNSFTYAITGNPTSLNPVTSSDRWGLTTLNMIYSPLIRIEGDGSQKFELAKSIESSNDGLVLTVKLRDDVKWSDGEQFNADDVVFTYNQKANKANGNAKSMWINDQQIKVTKVDDFTVKFELPSVSAAALENVATEVYIMPEHAYKDIKDFSGNELSVKPVGTGPYKLVEYKPGEYLQFAANENYYGGKPSVETVVLRVITSNDTAKVALQSGEVDAAVVLPSDIATLDSNKIKAYPYSENRVGYMGINLNNVTNVNVRKAIMFALNKEEMNKAAYLSSEYFVSPNSILPPNNPFSSNNVERYEHNVEKAKALLAEAGVSNLKLKLGYTASDAAQTLQAALIQQQLQQVGVSVELAAQDNSALFAELRKPDSKAYDLFLGGYIMGNDPDMYSALYATGQRANYFKYSSPVTDKLFAEGAVELDGAKRKAIYEKLQQQIADDAIVYPIVDNRRVLAVSSRIENVEAAGLVPIYTFEDLSKIKIK